MPVGKPGDDGSWPEGCLGGRVAARLRRFGELRRAFAREFEHGGGDGNGRNDQ
jgi:hypothetical protein